MRARVRQIWKQVYNSFDNEYTRAAVWETAKQACASYLIEETRAARRATTHINKAARALLARHLAEGNSKGPSPKFTKTKTNLEQIIRNKPDPEPKTGWWAYVSALKEELSTKMFYRIFKRRLSKSDMQSSC